MRRSPARCPRAPRGAALLLAMLILVLVSTLAAGMVWQQRQAVQVEAAERARAQAGWILAGALDWARLILREDGRVNRQRPNPVDAFTEPWATPLAEARLSSFLAADQNNNADPAVEAFISGSIGDAQARYNLRNLLDGASGQPLPQELQTLNQLCSFAALPAGTASRIAEALRRAWVPQGEAELKAAPLPPARLADLALLGLEPALLARLAPWVDILPTPTPINANTAPREVLAAVLGSIDLGGAERLLRQRQQKPFDTVAALQAELPPGIEVPPERVALATQYFDVQGRLRLDERVLEERSLLRRVDSEVVVVRTERRSLVQGQR